MGLDGAKFAIFYSNILNEDHLPAVNQAYSKLKVVHEERLQHVTKEDDCPQELAAFAIKFNQSSKIDKSNLICSMCSKSGHDTLNWWLEKNKQNGKGAVGSDRGG